MNKNEFLIVIKKNFPFIKDDQLQLFNIYKAFLEQENKKYNLTRLDASDLIYEKYFYNSIIPFIYIDLVNKQILDIGSGSGTPGIILKIIEPSISLTIIESNKKKVAFMQSLCQLLNFKDVNFICDRAELCANKYREKFDIVTSRAVSALNVLLEISCQFAKIGALIIEPKSVNYELELNQSLTLLEDFGLSEPNIIKYDDRNIILIFKKIQASNAIYPREWKDIIKNNKKENIHG